MPKRVFLITIDTLRRDHLSFYGYPLATTPFISKLASQSVVFEEAICSCSNTTPSHTSIFTGLHMAQHQMFSNGYAAMTPGLYFVSDLFRDLGYETAGFGSVRFLELFGQGFNTFRTYEGGFADLSKTGRPYRPAKEVADVVLPWLRELESSEKAFGWFHFYDPHEPYGPPRDLLNRTKAMSKSKLSSLYRHWTRVQHKDLRAYDNDKLLFVEKQLSYDAEMLYVDQQLERLYKEAASRGLLEDSLWIITADHGEGLGGHIYTGHGRDIYQDQLSCPLLFHTPGKEYQARAAPHRVHHIDLMPTLAAIMGREETVSGFTFHGRSLLPLLLGDTAPSEQRTFFAQRRAKSDEWFSAIWEEGPIYALLRGSDSYIYHPEGNDEVYDLASDPYQVNNLIEARRDFAANMRAEATAFYDGLAREGGYVEGNVLPPSPYEEDLKALGYL